MSARKVFGSSQKRRLGGEATENEPSTSRGRHNSPVHENQPTTSVSFSRIRKILKIQNFNAEEYEFSESDMSDIDYEEKDLQSEDEYEKDDDHILDQSCIAPCAKATYDNDWKRNPPRKVQEFQFQPPNFAVINYDTEVMAFLAIISPRIINIIVTCTNTYITHLIFHLRHQRKQVPKCYKETNSAEIRALIGLWLRLGISGFHHSNVDEIFSSKKTCSLDAHLCFSKDRYKLLMRALRFDDKHKRTKNADGSWTDKLVHIREVSFMKKSTKTTFIGTWPIQSKLQKPISAR